MGVRDLQPVFSFKIKVQNICTLGGIIMIKVKCVLGYYDTKLSKSVPVGEEFEVSEERAKQLIKAKVAVIVADNAAEPVKAPKKGRAKKEA